MTLIKTDMMRIPCFLNKSKSRAYKNAEKDVFALFKSDIEGCTLMGNPIIDRFLIHKTIIRTHERLEGDGMPAHYGTLSHGEYRKILSRTAKAAKKAYFDNYPV